MDLFTTWLVETPIAHRGLHDDKIPENSLAAFQKAIDKGYNIELDVQMISDGTLVVFHDEKLSRMTGNDGYLRFLKKDDLKILTLKDTKEHIPTLEEVLEFVDGRTPLVIEIKNSAKVGELEQKVIDLLKKYNGKFCIMSFNPFVLSYFKIHAKDIIRGQLSGSFKKSGLKFLKRVSLASMGYTKKLNIADFIAYEAESLPCRHCKKFKRLPLIAWTVKSQIDYLKVVRHCDNVIFEGFEPKI